MTTEMPTYPRAHERYYQASAEFVRRHPLWQRATKTPFAAKVTKYTLGSVVAFAMSTAAFWLCYLVGFGTTACSIIGFLFGAVPNWILNRRWAWEQTGRAPAKQIITYIAVSAFVLASTSLVTGWTDHQARGIASHGERSVVVTAAYVAVTVILFAVKFVIYEFWVFHERSRVRTALRSLMNVTRIARANRIP